MCVVGLVAWLPFLLDWHTLCRQLERASRLGANRVVPLSMFAFYRMLRMLLLIFFFQVATVHTINKYLITLHN